MDVETNCGPHGSDIDFERFHELLNDMKTSVQSAIDKILTSQSQLETSMKDQFFEICNTQKTLKQHAKGIVQLKTEIASLKKVVGKHQTKLIDLEGLRCRSNFII